MQSRNKQLWSGDATNNGAIYCDTRGYTVFDVYCTDGLLLRGVRLFDTSNNRYYTVLGGSGGAYNGTAYIPAIWTGLMDIYDDHFYLHGITMYTIQDGQIYDGHHISAIYGVW